MGPVYPSTRPKDRGVEWEKYRPLVASRGSRHGAFDSLPPVSVDFSAHRPRLEKQATERVDVSMNLKHIIVTVSFLTVGLWTLASAGAGAADTTFRIKKCQDANGEWHYGDSADVACARSKVIEITETGVKTKEIAAPLTPEQLKERAAHQAEAQKDKQQAQAQAQKDQLLLSMYASESDITYVRDRKIADIETQLQASTDTVKSLRATLSRLQTQAVQEKAANKPTLANTDKIIASTQAQITTHEAAIKSKRDEEAAIRKQADADLARYRQIKGSPAPLAAGTAAATP